LLGALPCTNIQLGAIKNLQIVSTPIDVATPARRDQGEMSGDRRRTTVGGLKYVL